MSPSLGFSALAWDSVASMAASVNDSSPEPALLLLAVNDDHRFVMAPLADVRAPPER